MLILMFCWLLLGFCAFLTGSTILSRISGHVYFDKEFDSYIVSTWLGISVIAPTLLFFSVLTPLTPSTSAIVMISLIGASMSNSQGRNMAWTCLRSISPSSITSTTLLALGVAAYSSQIVTWFDAGLYHEQAIRWLAEYGSVPGLARIHDRLGFSSSWFALSAPFNHGILEGRVYSLTGGFTILLMLQSFVTSVQRIVGGMADKGDMFLASATIIVVPLVFHWRLAISPSPDVAIIALTTIIVWLMLKLPDQAATTSSCGSSCLDIRLLVFILSIFSVTVKLSAFPLVIVSGIYYIYDSNHFLKRTVFAASIGALLLTPTLLVNTITSGYPLFPSSLVKIELSWRLTTQSVQQLESVIQEWARWGGVAPPGANGLNWIAPWIEKQKLFSALVVLSLISLTVAIPSVLRRKATWILYPAIIAVSGITFIFYKAPEIRFGLAYLIILPALLPIHFKEVVTSTFQLFFIHKVRPPVARAAIAMCTTALIFAHIFLFPNNRYLAFVEAMHEKQLWLGENPHTNIGFPPKPVAFNQTNDEGSKADHYEIQRFTRENSGGVFYFRPVNGTQCWDSPLPCIPGKLRGTALRNPRNGLLGGFESSPASALPHDKDGDSQKHD